MKKYFLQVYRHTLSSVEDEQWIKIDTLGTSPEIVRYLADIGIIEADQDYMASRHVLRLQKLMRLRRDLGVNLPGAAIIVDLLERIERLEDELERLKRR